MPSLIPRFVLMKMRRLFQIFTLICSLLILLIIMSKWSTPNTTNENIQYSPPIPPTALPIQEDIIIIQPKILHGRSDLPKYIHLDLKGAPPKANAFYPNFFQFIDKLQMGVKGVLIEYEDTLPLQGRLVNV